MSCWPSCLRCKTSSEQQHQLFLQKLQTLNYQDTTPYVPDVREGKVIKVYDGDTITIASQINCSCQSESKPFYRFSVRLNGIDTPEIKGKNPEEKEIALLARDALSERIMGEVVRLHDVSLEKYGRLLAHVYHRDRCLNNWMIQQRWAVPYQGGTKLEVSWKDYHEGRWQVDSV